MVQAPEQVFLKGLQPWRTCAVAEEKCEKDGVAEKPQNVQTTTPLHHPILPWREQSVPAAVTRGREVSVEPGGGVRFP